MSDNLHRNNAAEWFMWACLLPVFAVLVLVDKIKGNREGAKDAKEGAKIKI
jgi:hypothetical protein